MSTNSGNLLTVLQVAKELGVSDARVRQIIRERKLDATRMGNRLLVIERKSLDQYKRRVQ